MTLPNNIHKPILANSLLLGLCVTISSCTQGYSDLVQPKPETQAQLDYQTPMSVEELFEYARSFVELETGTDLEDVSLKIVDENFIQEEVAQETGKLVRHQFGNPNFAEIYLSKTIQEQTGTYTAIYSHNKNSILINDSLLDAYTNSIPEKNTVKTNKALLVLLLHELTHAADDKIYGIQENRILNFKSSFVQSAAFEGHAQLVTRNICKQKDCLEGMNALENFMFEAEPTSDPVAQSVQAISRNVLEYSYIEGEKFLTALQNKPNGEDLISQVLSNPPDDPIQILVPDTFPDIDRESRNQFLETALRTSAHEWNTTRWAMVETSTIKGIDVRNNEERRAAAIEGFTRLIDSMSAAQIFDQESDDIKPIDIMLIHTENEQTAVMFAESFAKSSSTVIETQQLEVDIEIINTEMGFQQVATENGLLKVKRPYTEIKVRPLPESATNDDNYSSFIGIAGRYVIQISGEFPSDLSRAASFAKAVMNSLFLVD